MAEPTFADSLSVLCAKELPRARVNPERMGVMIERLINSLAFTIAVCARGDSEQMQKLITGAEAHLYEQATGHARFAELFEALKPTPSKP